MVSWMKCVINTCAFEVWWAQSYFPLTILELGRFFFFFKSTNCDSCLISDVTVFLFFPSNIYFSDLYFLYLYFLHLYLWYLYLRYFYSQYFHFRNTIFVSLSIVVFLLLQVHQLSLLFDIWCFWKWLQWKCALHLISSHILFYQIREKNLIGFMMNIISCYCN